MATFPSVKAASQVLGISEIGISAVLKGRQILCSGFGWAYGKASRINIKSLRKKGKLNRKKLVGQKISQYNAKGRRIGTYLSIADAARAAAASLGITASYISGVLGTQKTAKGSLWEPS
jgi:hypothetical protein